MLASAMVISRSVVNTCEAVGKTCGRRAISDRDMRSERPGFERCPLPGSHWAGLRCGPDQHSEIGKKCKVEKLPDSVVKSETANAQSFLWLGHQRTSTSIGQWQSSAAELHVTCIHAYMHAYIHTCTHMHTHTCIHAYMHTCTYIHTYIQAYIRMYAYTHICTCMHACMYVCMYAVCTACTAQPVTTAALCAPERMLVAAPKSTEARYGGRPEQTETRHEILSSYG